MSNGSFAKHYNQLLGWKIVAYREEEDIDGGDPWPIFTLQKTGFADLEVTVLCDPEGNGAGFLDLQHPAYTKSIA